MSNVPSGSAIGPQILRTAKRPMLVLLGLVALGYGVRHAVSITIYQPGLSAKATAGILALLVVAALPWRFTLALTTLAIVGEGALRKWVFPDFQVELYALKYLLLGGAYLRFFIEWAHGTERIRVPKIMVEPLFLYAGWVCIQALNPNLPAGWIGTLGVVHHLGMIPLLVLMPRWCRTPEHWSRFCWLQVIVSLIPLTIGTLQWIYPATHVLNTGLFDESSCSWTRFRIGEYGQCRSSGTFSYLSNFVLYLSLIFWITLSLSMSRPRSRYVRLFLHLCLAWQVLSLFAAFSRTSIIYALTFPALALLIRSKSRVRTARTNRTVSRGLWVVGATLGALLLLLPVARLHLSAVAENTATETFGNRVWMQVFGPVWGFMTVPDSLLGKGSGTQTHLVGRVAHTYGSGGELATVLGAERPMGENLMKEMGLPGLIFYYALRLALIVMTYRSLTRSRDRDTRSLLLLPFSFALISLLGMDYTSVVMAFYLWTFAGCYRWAMESAEPVRAEVRMPADSR